MIERTVVSLSGVRKKCEPGLLQLKRSLKVLNNLRWGRTLHRSLHLNESEDELHKQARDLWRVFVSERPCLDALRREYCDARTYSMKEDIVEIYHFLSCLKVPLSAEERDDLFAALFGRIPEDCSPKHLVQLFISSTYSSDVPFMKKVGQEIRSCREHLNPQALRRVICATLRAMPQGGILKHPDGRFLESVLLPALLERFEKILPISTPIDVHETLASLGQTYAGSLLNDAGNKASGRDFLHLVPIRPLRREEPGAPVCPSSQAHMKRAVALELPHTVREPWLAMFPLYVSELLPRLIQDSGSTPDERSNSHTTVLYEKLTFVTLGFSHALDRHKAIVHLRSSPNTLPLHALQKCFRSLVHSLVVLLSNTPRHVKQTWDATENVWCSKRTAFHSKIPEKGIPPHWILFWYLTCCPTKGTLKQDLTATTQSNQYFLMTFVVRPILHAWKKKWFPHGSPTESQVTTEHSSSSPAWRKEAQDALSNICGLIHPVLADARIALTCMQKIKRPHEDTPNNRFREEQVLIIDTILMLRRMLERLQPPSEYHKDVHFQQFDALLESIHISGAIELGRKLIF